MKMSPVTLHGRPLGIYTRGGSWHPSPDGFPTEVRVSGDRWSVLLHSKFYLTRSSKSRLLGVALCRDRILVCDPDVPRFELEDTLAHEVAHAWIWTARQQDRRLAKLDKDAEEAVCELLAREMTRSGWRP